MFFSKKNFIIFLCLFISLICAGSPIKELKFRKNKEDYFAIVSIQQDTKIASFGIKDDCFEVSAQKNSINDLNGKVSAVNNELVININDLKWNNVYMYYIEVITDEGDVFITEKFIFNKKIGKFVLSTESEKLFITTFN